MGPQPGVSAVSWNIPICKPTESSSFDLKGTIDGDAGIKQGLNQSKTVVDKPEGENGRPVQKKPSAPLRRHQRARNGQQHKPVVWANTIGSDSQREVCKNKNTHTHLPGLSTMLDKNV